MSRKKPSKSELVRRYIKEHPDASGAEVAKACKCKLPLVYNVRASVKKKKLHKQNITREPATRESGLMQAAKVVKAANGKSVPLVKRVQRLMREPGFAAAVELVQQQDDALELVGACETVKGVMSV